MRIRIDQVGLKQERIDEIVRQVLVAAPSAEIYHKPEDSSYWNKYSTDYSCWAKTDRRDL